MKKLFVSKNFIICALFVIASIIGGFLLAKILPGMPVVSDSVDYHTIAKSILETGSYATISNIFLIYPPLYPIFVALVYSITHIGAYSAVYFAQYILVGITAAITFWILKNSFGLRNWIAIMGGVLVLFWPYFVLYSQIVSSEILYIVLLVGFFAVFLKISESRESPPIIGGVAAGRGGIILAGILLGLAILTRPVALLLVPWIIIGGFLLQKFFRIPEVTLPYKKYFLVFLIALATLIPWETYVYAKYNRIIPVASNLGVVFNKANKTLSYLSPEAKPQENTVKNLAIAKIKNVYLFWNPGAGGYHLDIIKQKYPVLGWAIASYKIGFFAILAIAFLAVLWYRRNTNVLLATLLICYFWALHTVLFPFPRYMMPVVPFMIMLAMVACEKLIIRYGNQKTPHFHTSEK